MTNAALIRSHWSARAWLRTAHVVTGLPVSLAAFVALGGLTVASVLLVWTVIVPIGASLALFRLVPVFTSVQRARFAAYLGTDIPATRRDPVRGNPVRRLMAEARTPSAWRQLLYHVVAPLIAVVGFLAVVGAWSGSIAAAIIAVRGYGTDRPLVGSVAAAAIVVLLVAGPWLAHAATALDTIAAESLLGPSRGDRLELRVRTLAASRADAVDAADAERRRIERDLHDGTQQRLVALAMHLGVARAAMAGTDGPAHPVIVRAHEETKLILKELRGFIQGLRPAVLDDGGLDAALSGLAAGAPVPVRLVVDLPRRPSPTIEAVAYFVVSESLTNVAKHAGASAVEVAIRRDGDTLRLTVRDDGVGGADPAGGSGLRGLTQRVNSVDGTVRLDSPAGGPTTITVDLPCE